MTTEVFPLIWSQDPGAIADWATNALGLTESWRADGENGQVEHVELHWQNNGGKVSINIQGPQYAKMGPSGISLRIDDKAQVDAIYLTAQQANADILQPLAESPVAYSFTAIDPDGNQWWVNAETGFLDKLRNPT